MFIMSLSNKKYMTMTIMYLSTRLGNPSLVFPRSYFRHSNNEDLSFVLHFWKIKSIYSLHINTLIIG